MSLKSTVQGKEWNDVFPQDFQGKVPDKIKMFPSK